MLGRMRHLVLVVVLAGVAGSSWLGQAPPAGSTLPRLVVAPSERARTHAWLEVDLPPTVRGADLLLRDEQSRETLPLQIGPDRQAWAILPTVPADQALRYRIEPALRASGPARVTAVRDVSRVHMALDGRAVFTYVGEPGPLPAGVEEVFLRGGYLHPVYTPAGRRVTEDYPPNHRHHHGIWAAWTRTRVDGRAPDFWNMGDRTGRVEFERLGHVWSGPMVAGFETRHRYMDLSAPTPRTILLETWQVRAYAWPDRAHPAHVFDLVVRQELVGTAPLALPTYRYGGVGMRGRHEWDGAAKTFFVTATGRSRGAGHGTRATWAHMSGDLDGRRAGIAMLSHPENVASPQPMRIHPTEPFFNFAPQQAGPLTIRPGEVLTLRYRFVVTDGPPDAAWLDAMWQDYALPLRASVR